MMTVLETHHSSSVQSGGKPRALKSCREYVIFKQERDEEDDFALDEDAQWT